MYEVRISVRELVEFILRNGDIDNRKESGADPDAMQEGVRIHKKIQKSMPAGYTSEVTLKESFFDAGDCGEDVTLTAEGRKGRECKGDVTLTVEGRADGVWKKQEDGQEKVIIDEIKSMYANLDYIDEPRTLHLAQAKCYAAMYAGQNGLDEIDIQLTYCDIDTEDIKRFRYGFKTEDIRNWFTELTKRYLVWAHMMAEHEIMRNDSIAKLEFPFEYRPGQKDVARDVYRAVKRGRNLFIQAPTGTGKTLSVMYPSLKAMPEKMADKIFYLTAKTVTAKVAVDCMKLLEEHGLNVKAVHITAKEKACLSDEFICNPDACPYADGHYDRINDAVYDVLTHETIITRDIISDYADKHRVCPYEFSLDISNFCDVIIADYNYAFDPRVKLRRYFSEGSSGEYIMLIDEAHNLVQRACNMYSAALVKEDILECARNVKGMDQKLTSALNSANRQMLALKRETEDGYTEFDSVDSLAISMERVVNAISSLLSKQKYFDTRDEVLDFFFKAKAFTDRYYSDLSGYRIYGALQDDGTYMVKLLCIDPSNDLVMCEMMARSCIFFSATLLPISYYKELLSGDPEDYAIYAESIFKKEMRLLAQAVDVSSVYKRRNDAEYEKIAKYIITAAEVHPGNYMVFFPSYDFMEQVGRKLEDRITILKQSPHMNEDERNAFLAAFDEVCGTKIGLCVMGGIFAEGIDLTDEKLIGAIVVGTGLPMINTESEIAKKHFDERGKDGFAYAYRYPGMNKVMQAAGRVIRKESDRGIILLLDERFSYSEYRRLFPKEWEDVKLVRVDSLSDNIRSFWENE